VKSNGPSAPATCSSNQAVTLGASMPSITGGA
jgi:hypothetical protein